MPLGFWMRDACEAAPAARVAQVALVALVAVGALWRQDVLVFPCFGAGPCGPSGLVLPLGLATLAAGGVGALAARSARALGTQLLLTGLGTLLVAVGGFREAGFAAAAYAYLPLVLATAAFAFATDGATGAAASEAGPGAALAVACLVAALGLPPFPGALARLAILAAAGPDAVVVWSLVLVTAWITVLAVAARGSRAAAVSPVPVAALLALALLGALAVGARPAYDYATRTARAFLDRQSYVAALGPVAEPGTTERVAP
jgi:multicomponent K+:H+ antiporter subunit D